MKVVAVVLAPLLVLAVVATAGAVTFGTMNSASGTAGGQRFDQSIGVAYANQVLSDASSFIGKVLNSRKPVNAITLAVEDMGGVAYTSGNGVHLSARYVNSYSGDVKTEVTGVLYHELTHVWQWNGQGRANSGLIEGIADYVRLKAGYAPGHWVEPGQGDRWDQGYDVTARFLEYCDSLKPGFVTQLNAMLKNCYSDMYFVQISGKCVQELWHDYKDQYDG